MLDFCVDNKTCAVVPLTNGSKVIDNQRIRFSKLKPRIIMNKSCKFYGSSLEGRIEGAKNLLGSSYKLPIVLDEEDVLIFFPTSSLRSEDCAWINLKMIDTYYQKNENIAVIVFKNNEKLLLNLSYGVLDKQILRASRLDSIFLARKKYIKKVFNQNCEYDRYSMFKDSDIENFDRENIF